MKQYRRAYIESSIKFIKLFEDSKYVTAKMVMSELGICRSNSHRWIRDASLVMPIYESGRMEGSSTKKYSLLK